MIRHYVTFFFPGTLFDEEDVKPIEKRGEIGAIPKGAYGYQEWSREEVEQDGELLLGKPKNHGPKKIYGVEFTLREVEELDSRDTDGYGLRILISNMRGNGWKRVVRTIRGNWQPVESGRVVVLHDERNALRPTLRRQRPSSGEKR